MFKMPSWWGKSSSKDAKKKTSKENFFVTLHRLISSSERKGFMRSRGPRHCSDTISELGSRSKAVSRSSSPSKLASRCQSFSGIPHAQPLPLPQLQSSCASHTSSGISTPKPVTEKHGKPPLPSYDRIRRKTIVTDAESELGNMGAVYMSCDCSVDGDDPADSQLNSPTRNEVKNFSKHAGANASSLLDRDHIMPLSQKKSQEAIKHNISFFSSLRQSASPKGTALCNAQNPRHGAFGSTPDSSMSSPSRSPRRLVCSEQILPWVSKPYPDVNFLSSGQCSSPGSGQTSGHNSMGGDMSGQLFVQHSRGSPECSPMLSPKKMSPGPSSRINSGTVTPLHPRAGGAMPEPSAVVNCDGKKQRHRLPLPPINITKPPFSPSNSACGSPSLVSPSPGRTNNSLSPGSQWKKGKLVGRGTFGHVYVGFNSETGEMCAVKEVTLFSDDAKSKESAKQLGQEITLLSGLRHPNIVQYYGSEQVEDKLYIYLEYVSGGSIHKLLQEYGRFGELAIRNYTYQILSGLAYLHAKNTIHRDIKGANILVDPNGCVKLADFGMAKHISGQSCPLSFKGSPYWMAPEVIKNTSGYNFAVDIWSLGCTVLEMATSKPPWSQYEGIAAMFKIGNSKELPAIPDHLSEEGREFVHLCLQREPSYRPTAAELLCHPFVKNFAPTNERPVFGSCPMEPVEESDSQHLKAKGNGNGNSLYTSAMNIERSITRRLKGVKSGQISSDIPHRNLSCPVSPIARPIQQVSRLMSPPVLSPKTTSGSSTPLSGGNGPVSFKQLKQFPPTSVGYSDMQKTSKEFCLNGHRCLESKLDLFRKMRPESSIFQDPPVFGNNIYLNRQSRRDVHEPT